MKILYGVQATGNGHISRSREIVAALKQSGHEVFVMFSGRRREHLWDVSAFEPFTVMRGLTFAVHRGRIHYLETMAHLPLRRLIEDVKNFDAHGYDLVITDFEPVSARIARKHDIPSIGIGHQYAFRYHIPRAKWDPIALFILRFFAPADIYLGLHWYHFGFPILPPIIPNVRPPSVHEGSNFILIYLPFEDIHDVMHFIEPFSTCNFIFYTSVNEPIKRGHVQLKPYSRNNFLHDLCSCNGILCNAGFELVSEALHLGKKVLVRPLAGQFEQLSNAKALQRLRRGMVMLQFDKAILEQWLLLPQPPPVRYPYLANDIAAWVTNARRCSVPEFCNKAWAQVKMSSYVDIRGKSFVLHRSVPMAGI